MTRLGHCLGRARLTGGSGGKLDLSDQSGRRHAELFQLGGVRGARLAGSDRHCRSGDCDGRGARARGFRRRAVRRERLGGEL